MTTLTEPPIEALAPPDEQPPPMSRARRFVRGRPEDPAWVRPSLLVLLGATALLYLWNLGASGWANSYYSAAVQAASESWKAFFFGSLDASNAITVDKAPLFLWPAAILARVFGVNSWSILVPQALMGVASVGVLYATVRRWAGAAAGLIAGAVLALTPVAVLMFRFNNPDAMLVLLMTLGAYATVRAIEHGATRWVLAVGAFVGLAFLAKMLQALLVVPGFAVAYLVAAPGTVWRRLRQLALAGVAMVAGAGWWVAIVELWPESSRPYIGGSQTNSVLELIFGYNGFGRLTGDEAGSVGGGGGNSGNWGPTGITRLFNDAFGGQASWLIPAALLFGAALLAWTIRRPRTDRTRAAALVWGGWLVVTGLAISLGKGIIHEYYTVALAPAIGALIGIGATFLWRHRSSIAARGVLAAGSALSAWWASELLARTPDWHPGLGNLVLVAGVVGGALLLLPTRFVWVTAFGVGLAAAAALAGPATYSWATAAQPHSGAIVTAGPAGASGFGPGGGGGFPDGGDGGDGGGFPGALPDGTDGTGTSNGFPGTPPGDGDGTDGSSTDGRPSFPGTDGGTSTDGGTDGGGPGGGVGSILGASEPTEELASTLAEDADSYRWIAATISANQAAGYQLATGEPVMAIGGFNGTDPSPTLEEFQQYVEEGLIHWFIGGSDGLAGMGGTGSEGSDISNWVAENFESVTVDGTTLYDLTSPLS